MADTLTGAAPPAAPTEATLGDVARAVRHRWRFVLIPTVLAFLLAVIFVNVASPRFTGEAKLLLQSGDSYYLRTGTDRTETQQQIDEQAVASQVQVVMSRDIGREAIGKLGLVGNAEFDPLARGVGLVKRALVAVGLSKDPAVAPSEERILDAYFDHLVVYPVGKSRIVSVEFRSQDPDLAARGANTVAELYLGSQVDAQRNLARSASGWLGTSIDDLRKRVGEAEAKVESFRSRTGLLSGTGQGTLSAQQLSDLSSQLSQARSARSDSETKAKLIRDLIKEGRAFEIPEVANNELIRRLIEQRINLRAQYAFESRTLLPQHPRMKELNAQLGDLEGQIRGSADRTARTLDSDARLASARVDSLESAIEAQKKVVAQGNESEVQLRALEREARSQRDQLESYMTRYRDATARNSDSAYPAEARIVSRAVTPQVPTFPKKMPTVVLTTLAVALLCAGLVAARELLGGPTPVEPAPRGRDARTVRRDRGDVGSPARLGGPALVPAGAMASGDDAAPAPVDDPAGTPPAVTAPPTRFDFAALIERLGTIEPANRARRVLVTGIGTDPAAAAIGEGLATTLARTAGPTVLIDLDADDTSAPADVAGLTDLVTGSAPFDAALLPAREDGCARIGVGTLRNEALTGRPEGVDLVLSALEESYGTVVIRLLSGGRGGLLDLVAPRVDAVVIASDLEPAHPALVDMFEAAGEAGAREVVVAREHAAPVADSEAA